MVQYFGNPRNPRRRTYWSPASIAELLIDFDAELYAYSDAGTTLCSVSDPVYRWYDTTRTYYVEQTTLGNRPVYSQGANGKKFVNFNGSKRLVGSEALVITLRHMIVSVINRNSFSANTFLYAHTGGSGMLEASDQVSGVNCTRYRYYGANAAGTSSLFDDDAPTGSWETIAHRLDATNISAIRNGSVEGTDATTGFNGFTTSALVLGGYSSAGYDGNFKMQRHLIFTPEPSSGDQTTLQSYLAAGVPT